MRLWQDGGSSSASEQQGGALSEPLPQTAICFLRQRYTFDDGDGRAVALGLITRVGYLSSASGGAWAVVPYLYATSNAAVGAVTPPERLTMAALDHIEDPPILADVV